MGRPCPTAPIAPAPSAPVAPAVRRSALLVAGKHTLTREEIGTRYVAPPIRTLGGPVAGQQVLIHDAAGGVGTYAVQLARWRGARVIGTASPRNVAFLRELGCDEVVDDTTTAFETVVHDVDLVVDTIGGDTLARSWRVVRPGGVLVSIATTPFPLDAATHHRPRRHLHRGATPRAARRDRIPRRRRCASPDRRHGAAARAGAGRP